MAEYRQVYSFLMPHNGQYSKVDPIASAVGEVSAGSVIANPTKRSETTSASTGVQSLPLQSSHKRSFRDYGDGPEAKRTRLDSSSSRNPIRDSMSAQKVRRVDLQGLFAEELCAQYNNLEGETDMSMETEDVEEDEDQVTLTGQISMFAL